MEFIIGKKYEREFRYAFLLISGCAALRKDYWTEGSIEGGDPVIFVRSGNGYHTYSYDERVLNAQFAGEEENGDGVSQGFTEDGATWFALLRGNSSAISPDANWQNLMFQIAQDYHKQYSVLEYKQQENDEISIEQVRKIVVSFLELFHPDFAEGNKKRPALAVEATTGKDGETETQDVYGLSLRLALNGGGGHSEFVIGKIFFEKGFSGTGMKPMLREDAKKMDDLLARFERTDDGNTDEEETVDAAAKEAAARRLANLKESALNSLKDCVPDNQENNFLDYLFMDDEGDVKKVQALLSRTTDSMYELQCDEVKVLCISHLQWKSAAYDVLLNGKRAFRFTFDLNQSMTVKCLNCATLKNGERNYEILVEKNEMKMQAADEKTQKPAAPVYLKNLTDKNFGLRKDEMERAKNYGLIKTHARYRECTIVGKPCAGAVRCDSQVEKITDKSGATVLAYCKNCRYPEKVYFHPQGGEDGKGVQIPAFRIALDVNKMMPVDKSAAKTCKSCGRTFKSSKSCCKVCDDAQSAISKGLKDEKAAEAVLLYKNYASILPISLRLFASFKKKYCFEDDTLIVFVIGDKKYYYDKLSVGSTGILPAAEDENRRKSKLENKKR